MSISEQEEQVNQNLRNSLEELLQITPESLVRTDELGTALDFSDSEEVFERTLSLFRDLQSSELDKVPLDQLKQLRQQVQDAINKFQKIQEFDPAGQQNPTQTRDQIVQDIASSYNQYFEQLAPIIAFSVRKGTDFERLEREARQTLEDLKGIEEEFKTRADENLSEIKGVLNQVRTAAAEIGVAQHATHFQDEAEEHEEQSNWWFWATAVLAGVTLIYGLLNIYWMLLNPDLDTAQAVQVVIAKVLVFSVLSFGVVWSGKQYRASRHNYVVNKHRRNALRTFETFIKAAGDEQTKNAVLLQTTKAIFAQEASGFTSNDSAGSSSPQMIEVIKNIADQS